MSAHLTDAPPSRAMQRRSVAIAFVIFVVSFLIFSCRNLDAWHFPVLYGEDGQWTGRILSRGFFVTALRDKDFPTVGVVLMDQLALWISVLLPGGILRVPLVIAFLSNAFMAGIATLAALGLKRSLSPLIRFAMWTTVLLMPVGMDGGEIFGRVLNLPFWFPILQVLLVARMIERPVSRNGTVAALAGSLLAGWTFPVSIGITALAALMTLQVRRQTWRLGFSPQTWAMLGVFVLSVLPLQAASFGKGAATAPYQPSGFVEFSLARTTLYPLVSLVYSHLNDATVVALTLAVALGAGMSVAALRRLDMARRKMATLFIGSFLLYALATAVMRRGFTAILNGSYDATFPDRYFYGVNVLAVFAILVVAELLAARSATRRLIAIFWIALFVNGAIFGETVFELSHPALSWRQHGNWSQEVCATLAGKGAIPFDPQATHSAIASYPWEGASRWKVELPTALLNSLARTTACEKTRLIAR
ncbi:MAG: hypothetical protein ACRYHA_21735 [Janthinobacterium lividum]